MHIYWLPLLLTLALFACIDWHIWRELKKSPRLSGSLPRLHLVLAAVAHIAFIITALLPLRSVSISNHTMVSAMWVMLIYFMIYVPKTLWALFYQLARIKFLPSVCRKVAKGIALAVALLALSAMWHGTFVTPYRPEVKQVEISSNRLPKSFDGYRIVQFSDTHLGTYRDDTTLIAQCVGLINDLKPDVICFTGDLVSRTSDEAAPFANRLYDLTAPDGVLAVLGNHDYDDYVDISDEERRSDHEQLLATQEEAGWLVLSNSNTRIGRGNDTIIVAGTENYSTKRLPDYSNLSAALGNEDTRHFTVLLQHNPDMWDAQVAGKTHVDLTLSGHTHAFQVVLEAFGFRFSPAQYRYQQWGGLYTRGSQHIYVNTGIGMIGVPMRLGVPPEITLITLRSQ